MNRIDLKTDGHVHTSLCHHASGSMEEYVLAAIAQGLERLFFLEHLEVGINYFECTWLNRQDFDFYFLEGKRLREKYGDQLFIGLGVEVGYNPEQSVEIMERISERNWDRVALSYHFMKVGGQHYNLVSRKARNIEPLGRLGVAWVISTYFDNLLAAVETIPAEVVCHLDAVLRYHPEVRFDRSHYRQISLILEAMARKGMALEVNASGCRMRGEPFPAWDIVQEAVSHNIKLVAGSDAHRPGDVGRFEMLRCLIGEGSGQFDV